MNSHESNLSAHAFGVNERNRHISHRARGKSRDCPAYKLLTLNRRVHYSTSDGREYGAHLGRAARDGDESNYFLNEDEQTGFQGRSLRANINFPPPAAPAGRGGRRPADASIKSLTYDDVTGQPKLKTAANDSRLGILPFCMLNSFPDSSAPACAAATERRRRPPPPAAARRPRRPQGALTN
ncbi:hypothetical protein EVAR_62935_1 [Eumeta japonica]|uniref:Uncharacterized protein n=1 Tax=Eumeta variegata TaxID=151549 RepID=A0A4C1ZFY2_EUMVA|nr:hypothetical protein EVAR_62935_1 [Eumeta japonica]